MVKDALDEDGGIKVKRMKSNRLTGSVPPPEGLPDGEVVGVCGGGVGPGIGGGVGCAVDGGDVGRLVGLPDGAVV